ncbi:non-ribosomal peptide synthetase, partial [Pseudomonas putida]|nr:non-ribosomal peptide synthetase [Pseudomonas putida]
MTAQNIELVKRFLHLPLEQRKQFFEKMQSKGMSFARLPIPQIRDEWGPIGLSYAQRRQWFLWQFEPQSAAYNISMAVRFKGALDGDLLQRSLEDLVQRHESLRTAFAQDADQPVQVVDPRVRVEIVREPFAEAGDFAERLKRRIEAEAGQPFDLGQAPLWRVRLLQVDEADHVLILVMHHIVSDGWSMPILLDEWIRSYEGLRLGQPASLPALPIQYADYAIWQRQCLEAGELERQLAYWEAELRGEQPVLELPTDHPRPALQSRAGASLDIPLDDALCAALKQLAQDQGVTLFMLLLASYQTLLHRYSGQNDIRVGIPTANRNRMETEGLIGFFVNTQVLKAEFDLGTTFTDLLEQVQRRVAGAQAHQDLPFEQLVEALQPERSLSHSPLFQVMYNHQTEARGQARQLPGLTVETLDWERRTAQFDLTLETVEHAAGIAVTLTYATALFDEATIAQLAGHWQGLLAAIVAQPQQRIAELPLLNATQQQQVLHDWNRTQADYPVEQCLQQLIEAQVTATPDAPALVFADQALSYGQLNRR